MPGFTVIFFAFIFMCLHLIYLHFVLVDITVNPPADAYESDPSDIYEQSYLSDEDTSSLAG